MIHLYTGDGKGKTTAAVGQAIRAAGAGYEVIFSQFMKGNDSGELHSMQQIKNIRILRSRQEFGFYHTLSTGEKEELCKIHNEILDELIKAAKERTCRIIILDEVTYPVNWELLDKGKLQELLSYSGEDMEFVMTGRGAADFLTDSADYITEMKALRHPYAKGLVARRGIEY